MAQDEIKEPVPVEAQVPAGEVVEVTPVDAEPVAQIGSPTAKSPEQIDQDFSALQDSINLIEQLTNNPPEGMSAKEITDTIARNQEHVDTMLSQDAIANDPRAEAMQEAIAGEAVEVAPVDAVAVINETVPVKFGRVIVRSAVGSVTVSVVSKSSSVSPSNINESADSEDVTVSSETDIVVAERAV